MDAIPSGPFCLSAPRWAAQFFGKPLPSGFRRPASLRENFSLAVSAGSSPGRGAERSYASSRRRISRTFAVSSSVAGSMGGAQ